MDFDTKVWGPKFWASIHFYAFSLPTGRLTNDDKQAFVGFILSLQHALPCNACRTHLKTHLEGTKWRQSIKTGTDAVKFTWRLHNTVNKALNKQEISFDAMRRAYLGPSATVNCSKGCAAEAMRITASMANPDSTAATKGLVVGMLSACIFIAVMFYMCRKSECQRQTPRVQ